MDAEPPRDTPTKETSTPPMSRQNDPSPDLSTRSPDGTNPVSPTQEASKQSVNMEDQAHPSSTPAGPSTLPESRVHTEWKPSAVAMAKCDICDKRGRGTIYMCTSCSQSVCYDCCEGGRLGSGHILDHTSVSWDLHLASKEKSKTKTTATRTATARGGRGRGGRARGGITKRRGGRAASTVSINTREPTIEPRGTSVQAPFSDSSSLSDPPTRSSSPNQFPAPRNEEQVLPPISQNPVPVSMSREQPPQLPRIAELEPQIAHDRSMRQYQSSFRPIEPRYEPYDRRPSHTVYTTQNYTSQHYGPQEAFPPSLRNPSFGEPARYSGPPSAFETRHQPHQPQQSHQSSNLANYAQAAYSLLPPPPTEASPISRCPCFRELYHDLFNAVQMSIRVMPDTNPETHLYTHISRAWTRGKLSHMRHISEQSAFKLLIAISTAVIAQVDVPRHNVAHLWLKDLGEQLVAEKKILPLTDSLFYQFYQGSAN